MSNQKWDGEGGMKHTRTRSQLVNKFRVFNYDNAVVILMLSASLVFVIDRGGFMIFSRFF